MSTGGPPLGHLSAVGFEPMHLRFRPPRSCRRGDERLSRWRGSAGGARGSAVAWTSGSLGRPRLDAALPTLHRQRFLGGLDHPTWTTLEFGRYVSARRSSRWCVRQALIEARVLHSSTGSATATVFIVVYKMALRPGANRVKGRRPMARLRPSSTASRTRGRVRGAHRSARPQRTACCSSPRRLLGPPESDHRSGTPAPVVCARSAGWLKRSRTRPGEPRTAKRPGARRPAVHDEARNLPHRLREPRTAKRRQSRPPAVHDEAQGPTAASRSRTRPDGDGGLRDQRAARVLGQRRGSADGSPCRLAQPGLRNSARAQPALFLISA